MTSLFLDRVSNKVLGELLMEKGNLSESQVNEALTLSRHKGIRLGEALISLGYISRDALGYAIGEQYGLRPMELHPSMVDPELVGRFDYELLWAHSILPLILLNQELIVVVPDPSEQSGLEELANQLPGYVIVAQLGGLDQICRCLEVYKNENIIDPVEETVNQMTPVRLRLSVRDLPRFPEVPSPGSDKFSDWLIGLAATHPRHDVLIRDCSGELQVSVMPNNNSKITVVTEIGRWYHSTARAVLAPFDKLSTSLEYTRRQVAKLSYSISHAGNVYEFLIIKPIVHSGSSWRIRALKQDDDNDHKDVMADIQPLTGGSLQVVMVDADSSVENAMGAFADSHRDEHQLLLCQLNTRSAYGGVPAWPAPFVDTASAAQAIGATCVIFDYPVSFSEIRRLNAASSPRPAVVIFVPYQENESYFSPDLAELIARQKDLKPVDSTINKTTSETKGAFDGA